MDVMVVADLARREMARAGLTPGWSLTWDHARRRAGYCSYKDKKISLSKPLMALYDEAQVREVIAHEIAHALVGPSHGHDRVWAAEARRLGSTGRPSLSADLPRPPAPWRGICPNGHTYERYRRPAQKASCSRCHRGYDRRFLITWERAA